MKFCFYDESGNITSTLVTETEAVAAMQGGSFLACGDSVDDLTHYVDLDTLETREKAPLPFTYSIVDLEVIFTGLPPGLKVQVGNAVMEADGDDSLVFDSAGRYTIQLSGIPEYMEQILEVSLG